MNFGFHIRGSFRTGRRELVDRKRSLEAHCRLDPGVDPGREGYLSHYAYGGEFRELLENTGSVRGYKGDATVDLLTLDVDRPGGLAEALEPARRLAAYCADRYKVDRELVISPSGKKGFHVQLPSGLWSPGTSPIVPEACKRFAVGIARRAGVAIDAGIYDTTRAIRAINTRHPETGLYKRRIELEELLHLSAEAIAELAREPFAFDPPEVPATNEAAVADWLAATASASQGSTPRPSVSRHVTTRLNRLTSDFIRDGAAEGERARRLFSAAANLGEFGCPEELAFALLEEPGLDCGLPAAEVSREIRSGLRHGRGRRAG